MAATGSHEHPAHISVPERHANALSKFAGLPPEKRNAIYRMAAEIPASTDAWDVLKDAIATNLDGSPEEAKALTAAIMGLFYVRQRSPDQDDSEFVQSAVKGIQNSITKNGTTKKKTKRDDDLQSVLVNVLALDNLGLAYRAGRIRFDHANHMHDAGIVTDLRPIFNLEASAIEGAVIAHILKIDYAGTSEDTKDLYLAVDDSDLDKLESAVKRARRKALALRSFAKRTNLKIIEDKS